MSAQLHDLTEINRKLAARVDDVVKRLFGNAELAGNYWRMGDKYGAPGQSLGIWRTGPKQGEWCDYAGAREGGQMLSLIVNVFGGDWGKAIRWAADFTGENARAETKEERAAREKRDRYLREKKERDRAANIARMRRLAKGLFLSAGPIAGTPAERYLRGRAIDLSKLPRLPGSLRFHPAVKFPDDNRERPCLLAAVVDAAGLLTVHRHWLDVLSDGRVIKARVTDPKRAYSSWDGGIIPLWRGQNEHGPGPSWRDIREPEAIIVTEGVEDGLSIALAMPDMRIGCSVTLGNLGKIWLPDPIEEIYWHRHRDTAREALSAYVQQCSQLAARGVTLREVFAPGEHKDFNDWLKVEAGIGEQERLSA